VTKGPPTLEWTALSADQRLTARPPSVTARRPSEAKDQPRAPLKPAQREPFVPDQNWLVASELPMIRSLVPLPLRHEVLFRNTEVPASKLKLRSVLSMLRLFEMVIEPGLLLYVNPCLPFLYAMVRRTMWLTPMSSPPSLKPLRSPLPAWPPLLSVPLS
jgi:hypothetical protein